MLAFFQSNITDISTIIIYVSLTIYALFVLFYYLYKKLQLKISVIAIICFYINIWIMLLFIFGFIMSLKYKEPIYLENISVFSQYKYLIFTIIVCFLVILFLIDKIYYFDRNNMVISLIKYPYLKKQINDILDCFVESHLSNIYESIFQKLYKSQIYKTSFFLIHFILIHGTRLVNTVIFLNFVLFHGDLRIIFLLLPLSFAGWLLQYLECHFITYIDAVSEESKKLFSITVTQQESASAKQVTLLPQHVNVSITEYGRTKGLTVDYIDEYHDQWILLMNFKYKFSVYKKKCFFFDRANVIIRIMCWVIITDYFFFHYVV